MKKVTKFILTVAIIVSVLLSTVITAFGASTIIAFSKTDIKLGDEVTITVKLSGADMAGVQFSLNYDTTILTYKSCSGSGSTSYNGGSVVGYYDSGSNNSYTANIVFKANKVGSTTVSVKNVRVSDSNGSSVEGFDGAAAKLVVNPEKETEKVTEKTTTKAPETTTRRPSETTTVRQTTENVTEATTKSGRVIVVFEGNEYEIARDSAFVDAPDGFDETYSDFKGSKVLTYTSTDKSQQIIPLMNSEGKITFVLFNDEEDTFGAYVKAKSSETEIIILPFPKDKIPSGYFQITLPVNDREVDACQNATMQENNMYLVYGIDGNGKAGFYVYDNDLKTFQKFVEQEPAPMVTEVATEKVTEETAAKDSNEPEIKTKVFVRLFSALGVLFVATLIMAITFGKKLFKNRNKNDDVVEYTY